MSTEDDYNMEEAMDTTGYEEESGPLFWSMKLEPNQPQDIDPPAIDGYIVHVTNACFGANVTKQSRTVVMVKPSVEDEEENNNVTEVPICVLRQGNHENHQLDLLFNESATISIKGQKPSVVYLTGYLQPPVEPDMDAMNPMLEDMNEEEVMKALKMQKQEQMRLDDEEDEEEEDEEEPQLIDETEFDEPPTKKQKTSTGSKSTKNGSKTEVTKKRKSPQQKPVKSPSKSPQSSPKQKPTETTLDDKKEQETKGKKKKNKKFQQMKGGIKYRDMKVGDGKQISNGDKLSVYYVGQTDNKQVFDKCINGNGFEFNFGKGDVIKGWDMGLKGMRVGGKRKLIIPPKLGYGQQGSPPKIGSNATLTFTIEIKGAN